MILFRNYCGFPRYDFRNNLPNFHTGKSGKTFEVSRHTLLQEFSLLNIPFLLSLTMIDEFEPMACETSFIVFSSKNRYVTVLAKNNKNPYTLKKSKTQRKKIFLTCKHCSEEPLFLETSCFVKRSFYHRTKSQNMKSTKRHKFKYYKLRNITKWING